MEERPGGRPRIRIARVRERDGLPVTQGGEEGPSGRSRSGDDERQTAIDQDGEEPSELSVEDAVANEVGELAGRGTGHRASLWATPTSRQSVRPGEGARRLSRVGDLDIVPLTPRRLAALAGLFGQGGDPKWCWCAYWRVRGRDWTNSTADENRAVLEAAVDGLAADGRAPGLVAYRDGEAVGWVSLGPRPDYDRIVHSTVLAPVDDRPVWSIVCFVVGRRSRGRGIATALLDAGVDYARDNGATLLEAYPLEFEEGRRVRDADVFRGTLSMFERAGFKVVDRRLTRGGPMRTIVRRAIRPRRRES
jgi:GNAT superfamily N-acetyltransferase